MAITIRAPEAYKASLRKLFPRGPYWDTQFKNPESDAALFCEAKADFLVRIRKRMSDLQRESVLSTAVETLDDWERVLLGTFNMGLDTAERRALLSASKTGNFNVETIKNIGRTYGITVNNVVSPFRPVFFGHSHFGIDPLFGPAAFAVLFIYASLPDENLREEFEKKIISRVLSTYIIYFVYGGT